jgi:hypothetical protein
MLHLRQLRTYMTIAVQYIHREVKKEKAVLRLADIFQLRHVWNLKKNFVALVR